MLITIHGFPAKTKYADVKTLIKEECKLDDFMLGNLMGDSDGTKKIRIGLSDDNEGYMVLKRLDGYRMGGNFILKTVPVGKPSLNPSTQNTFDTHPNFRGNTEANSYPNPSRNDFQPRGVYQNQPSNAYGIRGPHGMGGPSHGPHQNDMNAGRPSQWAPNTGPWASAHQSNAIANQLPQDNFNYPQQVMPHFEQQARQLRSIETVEVGGSQLPVQGRYQPPGPQFQQDKPITIMKENFQGPTPYNISNPTGGQQPRFPQQTAQPWEHHGQQTKPTQFTKTNPINYERPDSFKERETGRTGHPLRSSPTGRRISPAGRRSSPPGRRFSPSERKISPPGRRNSPPGRRFSPSGRRFSPPGKRISPTGRRISPTGRRISPTGRRISPTGRRISPFGRRISPSARPVSPGRRVSPTARRFSPSGRRISPNDRRLPGPHSTGRRESPPPKRVSPGRRIVSSPHRRPSPSRRESPNRAVRFSPGRHHADKPGKHVRPAYEPPHQASNQAIYPGGFRPNIHENVQHSGMRQDTQRPQWQREHDEYIKTQDEETRGTTRSEIPRDRNPQKMMESQRQLPSRKSRSPVRRERSPIRRERSPVRRERSPIRDRFKRHSPSPRSPRRSWAFEKRHSPDMGDAPPPPAWPGQKREDGGAAQGYRQARPILARDPIDQPQPFRPTFQKDDQHQPKWERAIEDDHNRRPVNQDNKFYKPPRELDRERHPSHTDRYAREPHFSPREGFDIEHHDDYRNPDTHPKKPYIQREDSLKRADDRRRDERRRREESPHLDITENLLKIDTIDKDFEDIYQRTLQFKKKAEEMRKSANRRGISEDVGHHSEREREEDRYEGDYGEDENRSKERSRQDYRRFDDGKAQNRSVEEHKFKRTYLDQSVKGKRAKAIDEITSKIMERHPEFNQLKGEQKLFFTKELNEAISRLVFDMFGNKDISFIEIIVKYQAKYNVKEEEKLLQNIVESLPSQYRIMKRHASESCGTPAKISKSSPSTGINQGKKNVPVRLNMKPVTEEARTPTKLPAQRTGQPMQSANSIATVPTKEAREEEDRGSLLLPPAPPAGGQYELSPLMTRMVESELKNVMIKVWQALPDNPASESDKHVVDKFRSTAGDDLMNVLGFNITQRLLNVYNPLSFKITFTGKPDKADLAAFLRKYNFIIFRRITTSINSFYAQVRTVADFDRLWAAKIVRCGKIRVAVKSLYKFSQCPKNLQTSFHGHGQMKEILNSDQKCNEKHTQDNSEDTLSNKSESQKKDIPIKHEKVEITVTPKEIKPVEVKSASKQNINIKKDEVKPTEKDKTDKEKTKPAEVAKQTKATVTENKSKGSQISTTKVKVTASGTGKKIEDAKTMKQSEAKKIDDKSKNTIPNPNEKSNKAQPRQIAEIKPEKLQSNLNSNTKSVTLNKSPRAADAKVIKKSSVPVSQNRPNAPEKKANDFDELDDYDILALMSEGIVLDECTGSDEE